MEVAMENNTLAENNYIKVLFKNLILEFLVSLILMLILSILLTSTSLDEDIINPAIIFISAFSILLGSFLSSKKIKLKGIIVGVIQGILYMAILYFVSSILSSNFKIGIESIAMISVGIVSGILGGIIGANLK
jgi:putative membrane protein (TIGR04086 family)